MADAKHLKLPAGVLFCSDSGAPQDVSHDTFVRRTLPIASPPPNIVNEEQYSRFSQYSRTNSALPEFNSSIASVKPPFSGSATHPRLEQSIVGPVHHGDQFTSNGNSWLFTASSHSRQLARLPPGQISLPRASLPPREEYDASQPTYKPATHAGSLYEAAPSQHERFTCEEFIYRIDFEARKLLVYVEFYNGAARAQLKVQHTGKSSFEKTLVDIDNIKRSLERIQDIIQITERACKEAATEDTYRANLASWHDGH